MCKREFDNRDDDRKKRRRKESNGRGKVDANRRSYSEAVIGALRERKGYLWATPFCER